MGPATARMAESTAWTDGEANTAPATAACPPATVSVAIVSHTPAAAAATCRDAQQPCSHREHPLPDVAGVRGLVATAPACARATA